jgi:hypothetical protein
MTIQTANLGKVQPLWRGEFSASPAFNYKPTDQLTYAGSLYVAIQESDGSILPTDSAYFSSISGVDSIRLNSVVAFTISQYAGGDSSAVAVIVAGLSTTDIDYFVDSNTYQVFDKNGATGTFSDPLDFDPETGVDSGITGTLLSVSAPSLSAYSDKKFWPTIANDVTDAEHDIVFSAGKILSSDGLTPIDFGGMTKRLDATWAAGTNAGGLFSGTIAADETYHCFVIVNDSDGSVDCGFDTDPDCSNIPTGYTAYRYVHSVLTDSSSNILGFSQRGDSIFLTENQTFLFTVMPASGSAEQVIVTAPSGLPDVIASLSCGITDTGARGLLVGVSSSTTQSRFMSLASGLGYAQLERSVAINENGGFYWSSGSAVTEVDSVEFSITSWTVENR